MQYSLICAGIGVYLNEGSKVLALTHATRDGYFVGTDGFKVKRYKVTKESRETTGEELKVIHKRLKDNGLTFCLECLSLEPCKTTEEELVEKEANNKKHKDLQNLVDDFFDKLNDILGDHE